MNPVYMDHHATTPVHPDVLEAMLPFFREEFGNPASTTHALGRRAAAAVEAARASIAGHLAARPREIVFTSGATESNNLALRGVAIAARERHGSAHLVVSAIEHKSVLDTAADLKRDGVSLTVLPVDREGLVDPGDVRRAIRDDTCLVSIQFANSEIGTLQPIAEIAAVSRDAGVPLHTDAVQAMGRVPVRADRDGFSLLSLSGHKIYGPKGIGVLHCVRRTRLRSILTGGGHERNRRSGTLNVPAIVGLARALEIVERERDAESARLQALRDRLWRGIAARIEDVQLNGHATRRLPNNLNISFRHAEGESLLMAVKGFALSSGSACTSEDSQGSYVIRAIGGDEERSHGSIRIGLGRGNNAEQVAALVDQLAESVSRLRAISAAPV